MRIIALAALAVLSTGALQAVQTAQSDAALTLPSGFQLVDYATGQAPYNLTDFAWLDDGGLLTSGKDGTIAYVPVGGSPRILTQVPTVRALGDHGFLGFAPANDYATSGHVFVSYDKGSAAGTGYGMVEEWTASPPSNPTAFVHSRTLIDGSTTSPPLAQETGTHGIDSVVVAPDDTLFLTIGDDAPNNGDPRTLRAQDLDQPYGKLLHVSGGGVGLASNPFYSSNSPSSWRSMVYASGMRNPFRFDLDPRSGMVHLGDVGWNSTEEINTLAPGANAGWPCYEGTSTTTFSTAAACQALYAAGSARMPIATYPHAGSGAAVVGGMHYTGASYPPSYVNSFFYGDYARHQLWTLGTDAAGRLTRSPESSAFAGDAGGPVAFHPGPNGDVTYADLLTGSVRRLVYTTGNRAPVAMLTSSTDAATRTITFSAADSYDLDGDVLTYSWDFGDGAGDTQRTLTHTYETGTAARVTLTVHDQLGAIGSATITVHPANSTPQIVLDPPPDRTYAVGDTVELAASATDVEDGALTVSWDTALLHCPFAGSCHRHPDGTQTGPSYRAAFTDHGSDTTMLVTARAQDSAGAVATVTYEARPTLRTLTVNSPVALSINGVLAFADRVVAGSDVQLDAPLVSSYRRFQSWSDGGAAAHGLTMPNADVTLTARYDTAVDTKYAALAGASSPGTPTSLEYDIAGGRARNYAGGRIYWSPATEAHEVHGAILTKYLAAGGPAKTGFPTSDELGVTGGRASYFTGGRIYWASTTRAHQVTGPILTKYLAAGGPTGFGLPMTDVVGAAGGSYAHFTGARSIFWSAAGNAHLVYGAIRAKYAALGYQKSCLGYPTTDEYAVTDGRRNRFAGGNITYRRSLHRTYASC